jgi:UDP-glucose 4-epimerase
VGILKIVVTGGAGFIGSNLVDTLLQNGHTVLVVDNLSTGKLENLYNVKDAARQNRFAFHQVDIRDSGAVVAFKGQNPDVVMHLAAQADVRYSVKYPVEDADHNILGTINLLQLAAESGVKKFIFTSSGGCIYGEPTELPVDESVPRHAICPYGVSKNVVEGYLRYYQEQFGVAYTTLALANVYGPRQNPFGEAGVVAMFLGRILKGETCVIYGDGEQTRDFVYVEDVVDAFRLAMQAGDGELFNIGTGEETSVNQLYRQLADICYFEREPEYAPERPGELARISLAAGKAGRLLKWKPATSIREGLEKTAAWYEQTLKR